jgi:hypothetical protein
MQATSKKPLLVPASMQATSKKSPACHSFALAPDFCSGEMTIHAGDVEESNAGADFDAGDIKNQHWF